MVVDYPERERTDRVFHALADATRRDIVLRTLQDELSISTLARLYPMSFAAVQKHVTVLEQAKLITKLPHGRERLVRANVHTVRLAERFLDDLEQVWRGRLERLEDVLSDDEGGT